MNFISTDEKKLLYVQADSGHEQSLQKVTAGEPRPDLPYYNMDDVTKHSTMLEIIVK